MPFDYKSRRTWDEDDIREACRLYAVTDSQWLGDRTLAVCVAEAIVGGATFVQLREKDLDPVHLTKLARTLGPVCKVGNVPFVIDDNIEVAKASGADGVHIGQSDISCADARKVLGPEAIIGVSAQSVEQALRAQREGASYLGVGAPFSTSTKDAEVLPLEVIKEIVDAVSIPVVAIGGINARNVCELSGLGLAGVAVVSAIFDSENVEESTIALRAKVDEMLSGGKVG